MFSNTNFINPTLSLSLLLTEQELKDLIDTLPPLSFVQDQNPFVVAYESHKNIPSLLEKIKSQIGINNLKRLSDKDGESYVLVELANIGLYSKFMRLYESEPPLVRFFNFLRTQKNNDAEEMLKSDLALQQAIFALDFEASKKLLIQVIQRSHNGNEFYLINLLNFLNNPLRVIEEVLPKFNNEYSTKDKRLTNLLTNYHDHQKIFIPPIMNYLYLFQFNPPTGKSIEMLNKDANLRRAIADLNFSDSESLLKYVISKSYKSYFAINYLKELIKCIQHPETVIDAVSPQFENNYHNKQKIILLKKYLKEIQVPNQPKQAVENLKRKAESNDETYGNKKSCIDASFPVVNNNNSEKAIEDGVSSPSNIFPSGALFSPETEPDLGENQLLEEIKKIIYK